MTCDGGHPFSRSFPAHSRMTTSGWYLVPRMSFMRRHSIGISQPAYTKQETSNPRLVNLGPRPRTSEVLNAAIWGWAGDVPSSWAGTVGILESNAAAYVATLSREMLLEVDCWLGLCWPWRTLIKGVSFMLTTDCTVDSKEPTWWRRCSSLSLIPWISLKRALGLSWRI